MQEHSFFIKYADYRTGLRLVIGEDQHSFSVLHNQQPQDGDERFDGGFTSFFKLQKRLRELFPETHGSYGPTKGDDWFMYIFQDLFHLSERVKRRYKKKS